VRATIARMNHLDGTLQRDDRSLRQRHGATQTSLTLWADILFGTKIAPTDCGELPGLFHVLSSRICHVLDVTPSLYHSHSVGAFALTKKKRDAQLPSTPTTDQRRCSSIRGSQTNKPLFSEGRNVSTWYVRNVNTSG